MYSMKSMTGFGSVKGSTTTSYLEVNVRSINGRFLETRVHLPRELAGVESEIRKISSSFFQRGSIDIFVSRKNRGDRSNLKLFLHEEMVQAWLGAADQLSKHCEDKTSVEGLSSEKTSKKNSIGLDLKTLLQLPEVIGFEEQTTGIEEDAQELQNLVKIACENCALERQREGNALKGELLLILDRLEQVVVEMNFLRDDINRQLKEKMELRLTQRWSEVNFDAQRFQQELALLWDKADISEEMTRLKEHLIHYRNLVQSAEAQGKKLDFYTQELLREVNTIGSKSPLVQLTHRVVLAKTEIEKLREQVQNIE